MRKTQREKDITKVSVIGIISNGILGVIKVIVGITTNSIAIISDAVNNLTDTSSSIITIIGTHLATRQPDAKHPFGYGRVEYLTSLVIGLIVFFTGAEMCRTSIHSIIHPDHVKYNVLAAVILAVTVVVKIFLGIYTLKRGRKLESSALVASGLDAKSDAIATGAALFAVLLYLWRGISIDAWVGALISLYVVYTGFGILKDTVSKIVGEADSKELANKIYTIVKSDPMVKGAYDLVLNNYGPDFHIGSVNVEVEYNLTAEEICRSLHPLQMRIYHELRTIITFGLYAVDKSNAKTAVAAQAVEDLCKELEHCQGYHGLFVDDTAHAIYCDLMVDYDGDHDAITADMEQRFKKVLPGYIPEINIDTPFVSQE